MPRARRRPQANRSRRDTRRAGTSRWSSDRYLAKVDYCRGVLQDGQGVVAVPGDAGPLSNSSARTVGLLLGDPVLEVAAAVDDAPAGSEAAGSGAEVAPVAQGGDGDAENVGDFGDGEQLVVGVRVLGCLLYTSDAADE